ncbi:hypothetical protein [Amycolatopsis magusensis]|uniref:hypothetical protein n=1 Tax=Amycolatopsis magusensis TaxID=882444 RepID=UPI003793931B
MNDQEFGSDDREAYRDYADKVKISVRVGDMPMDEYVTEALEVIALGAAWPRKWLVDQVEDLPAEAVKPGAPPSPYAIDVIERRHEWGASAANFEILLYLASAMGGGIVGNAAYDAVKVVVKKMAHRLAASGDHGLAEPITEAEARERTEALINSRFQGRAAVGGAPVAWGKPSARAGASIPTRRAAAPLRPAAGRRARRTRGRVRQPPAAHVSEIDDNAVSASPFAPSVPSHLVDPAPKFRW